MDDEVQETNLDEVEVDDEGNLSRSSQYDMDKEGVHQPLRSDKEKYAADVHERGDGLSRREREALERRQRDKDGYTGDGTAEESAGMLAVERGDREDEDSDSSGSYLGLEAYPELTSAVAARSFGPPRPADPPSGLGAGHELHDIELSVIDPAASDVHSVERGEQPSHSKRYDRSLCGLVDLSVRFLRNSSPEKLAIFFAIVAIVVGVLLLCGLLPASFVYVEYYELALAKNRITGRVNRNEVYYPGCYLLTPATELIRFQGTAHILDLKEELRTSDRLPFYLGISLQYFIKRDQLGLLHRDYEHNYFDVVKSMVVSTLKNEAGKFSLDNFRLNRSLVEQELKEALSYRLGGDCCPSCCPRHCGSEVNCRSCRLPGRCSSRGIYMEMRYFQMGIVDIPDDIAERFLRKTVLQIQAEKEWFVQQHAVETKISQLEQQKILNAAAEIRENATAEASKIRVMSEAEFEKEVQSSYIRALQKFYQQLNVTQQEHRLSLMYIRALEDISDNLYNLNFEQFTSMGSP